ncbi:hypothetical protein [Nonomuraea rhodomycinica]|uniref:WD40-like Beta Propeller Repeat n=1 Tax=Nonomuraea rhodomycinica TaxID=1712872 RepID=A0A7Y6IWI2_9ACTN|nr:hypothetical protein [Nonomuraea rhodomycinica]NUW44349.1 hypothetical protein [Nonomuraea rhodomycinica]
MTRLRETLNDIADEAPLVNLADVAIAGYRRRRRFTTGAAALGTALVLAAATAATTVPWQRQQPVASQGAGTVPDLPAGKVGPLGHAYQTRCKTVGQHLNCDDVEWRVVTAAGATYRLPQALAWTTKEGRAPVSISRDGRMLAYYSRQAQAHVVRDLIMGTEVTSPVTIKEDRIGMGSMLVVSDDGRYVAFDPREGSKDPGTLIDMRTGRTVPLNGKYEVVSVRGGVAELVRYARTDLWLMPVTGGGEPVRFKGPYIMFNEVGPDGHTVVAVRWDRRNRDLATGTVTMLDVRTGRVARRLPIRGLPKGKYASLMSTGPWTSGHEFTVVYATKGSVATYAVDAGTGRARRLAGYQGTFDGLVLPGVAEPVR